MGSSIRSLLNNLGAIILALLLAFVVWISSTLQDDPFTDQVFTNVPIAVLNQPSNTVISQSITDRANVTARARQSVLDELKASEFEAILDLTGVEPGSHALVPIQVTCANEAVRIQAWDPEQETVHLEAVFAMTLPVAIDVEGQVATGYQTSRTEISPQQAAVVGPESLMAQVAAISGSIVVEGARENVVEQVVITPVDADGRLVPGLQWSPDRVQVEVEVRRKLGYKPDVEVVPDLRGEPATGYRLGSVTVEPSTVTLAGLPSILNELPGFVVTWPLSVTEATGRLVEFTPLNVPQSVVVVGVDFVTITVEVLPIESSRAMTVTVETQGLQPGYLATASPSIVDVILEGPDTKLSELVPSDIRVVLDLFGLRAGVHRLEPTVLAPGDIKVVSVIPETIEVVIGLAPTPTPTLTSTLTVTPTVTSP